MHRQEIYFSPSTRSRYSSSSFSLSPSTLSNETSDLIDYSSRSGSQLYEQATEGLELDEPFDGHSGDLQVFKDLLWERAVHHGWMGKNANIFDIPLTRDHTGSTTKNIITQGEYFSFHRLREWATDMIVNKETRLAQNDYQFYKCLNNSISARLKKQLLEDRHMYFINNTPVGILYFHAIMSRIENNEGIVQRTCSFLSIKKSNYDVQKCTTNLNALVGFTAAMLGIVAFIMVHVLRRGKGGEKPSPTNIFLLPFSDPKSLDQYLSHSELLSDLEISLSILSQIIIANYTAYRFFPNDTNQTAIPRGGFPSSWLTSQPEGLPRSDSDGCADFFFDVEWYDADGPEYNCAWYALNSNCQLYGNSYSNSRFGNISANDSCCACGGGFDNIYFVEENKPGDYDQEEAKIDSYPVNVAALEGITTNNQVENVDEADIVKSDGVHVFAAIGMKLIVWNARTGSLLSRTNLPLNDTDGILPCWYYTDVERLADCYLDPTASHYDGETSYQLPTAHAGKMTIASLLMSTNRISVIATFNLSLKGSNQSLHGYRQTRIFVYDTSNIPSNGSALVLLARKDLQGVYRAARMINTNVHIVTSSSLKTVEELKLYLSPNSYQNSTSEEQYKIQAEKVVANITSTFASQISEELESIGVSYDNIAKISIMLSHYNDTYIDSNMQAPSFADVAVLKSLMLVYSFDSSQIYSDEMINSFVSGIFFSPPNYTKSFYFSETKLIMAGEAYVEESDGSWTEHTALVSLTMEGPRSQFHSVGYVRGSVLNQFSIDHHTDSASSSEYLRVATTTWGAWTPNGHYWKQVQKSNNYVTVLKIGHKSENNKSNRVMERVGHLENISVGGRIFGCRFHDQHAYLATFESVAPFYILDLSDPTLPKIAGNLTVPGYSKYLHPVDNKFVIAVGQDVNGYGWDTGLRISKFNVEDLRHPKLVATYIDTSWSRSEALYEHKAFRYDSKTKKLILPVYYIIKPYSRHGFAVYDVDENAVFSKSYEILPNITYDLSSRLQPRSLIFNDNLTTFIGCTVVNTELESGQTWWTLNLLDESDLSC